MKDPDTAFKLVSLLFLFWIAIELHSIRKDIPNTAYLESEVTQIRKDMATTEQSIKEIKSEIEKWRLYEAFKFSR